MKSTKVKLKKWLVANTNVTEIINGYRQLCSNMGTTMWTFSKLVLSFAFPSFSVFVFMDSFYLDIEGFELEVFKEFFETRDDAAHKANIGTFIV